MSFASSGKKPKSAFISDKSKLKRKSAKFAGSPVIHHLESCDDDESDHLYQEQHHDLRESHKNLVHAPVDYSQELVNHFRTNIEKLENLHMSAIERNSKVFNYFSPPRTTASSLSSQSKSSKQSGIREKILASKLESITRSNLINYNPSLDGNQENRNTLFPCLVNAKKSHSNDDVNSKESVYFVQTYSYLNF